MPSLSSIKSFLSRLYHMLQIVFVALAKIYHTALHILRTVSGKIRKLWDKLSHFSRNIVIGILIAAAIPLLHHTPYASDWITQFEEIYFRRRWQREL